MPKYRKLRIERGTGAQESNEGLPEGGSVVHQDTPLKLTPSDFKPFKKTVNLTDPDNYPIGFIVTSSTGLLNAERVLIAGPGILITDNGPNNTIQIGLTGSALGQIHVFANNSSLGQGININFVSDTIDISGGYNSATGKIDVILSSRNVFSITLQSSAKGSGEEIIDVSGIEIAHKTLQGKGSIEIHTSSNNTLIVSAAPSPAVVSAASSGHFIVSETSSNEIVYKTIFGGGIVEVSSDSKNIYISAPNPSFPDIELSAKGSGIFSLIGTSGHKIFHRALDGRGIINLYLDNDTIVISAARGNIELSSLGTSGIPLFAGVSGSELEAYRIEGGLGIQENLVSNKIVLDEYWINANNSQRFSVDPLGNGLNSVAIGNKTETSGMASFILGTSAAVIGNYNIFVGTSGNVYGNENIAIGRNNKIETSSNYNIQIGSFNYTYGSGNTIQIGFSIGGSYSIHIGNTINSPAFNEDEFNYIIGYGNDIRNIRGLVIGTDNILDDDGNTAKSVNILIGSANNVLGLGNNLALGEKIEIAGSSNFVIGVSSKADYHHSYIFGENNLAGNNKTYIFGSDISASKSSAIYIGFDNVSIFVDSNGNVGINTENPTEQFEVVGNTKLQQVIISAESPYILPTSAGTGGYVLITNGAGQTAQWVDPNTLFTSYNWIHANEGNNFALAPSASAPNAVAIGYNVHTSAPYAIALGNNYELSAPYAFGYGSSGKTHFFINASGNVGIGTTNPRASLEINNPDENSVIHFINTSTGTALTSGSIIGLSGRDFIIENQEDAQVIIRADKRDRFVINNDEFVFLNGDISSPLDNTYKMVLLQGNVSNTAGFVPLFTENGNEIVVPASSIYGFSIDIIGKEDGTDQAAYYRWEGLIRRPNNISATTFIGFPLQNIIAESVSAVEWNVVVSAVSAKLRVSVTTGSATNTLTRWMAIAKLAKIKG